MKRALHKLTARQVATLAKPGRHSDGGNLYLRVSDDGRRRWTFFFRWQGKLKEMGMGSARTVSLALARERATEARRQLADRIDPREAKRATEREATPVPTFGAMADSLIASIEPGLRNAKHINQWRMTLREYAAPLRSKLVCDVTTADVLECLKPLWIAKPETAARLRGRIERVLDAAKAAGHRCGENPAAWKGNLAHLLPKRQRLARGHYAAMPYSDVPAFIARLREAPGIAPRALEFAIFTAARTGEVVGATWDEVDLDAALWTVPAARMKSGREHRVPLCARAATILREMAAVRTAANAHVFPGWSGNKGLSNMAFLALLRRLGTDVTAHGFRSAFRDWCGDRSAFPRDIAEAALAHAVGDATEAAYRRSDALEKRRKLMSAWGGFCEGAASNVVMLARAGELARIRV